MSEIALTPGAPCFGCDDCEPQCAGCGVVILHRAPRITLRDPNEAMDYGGTDWHPGCFDAEGRLLTTDGYRQHLARARAALTRPPTRRQV